MTDKTNKTTCRWCGIIAPKGHQRPFTWIEKHEAICAKNPTHTT